MRALSRQSAQDDTASPDTSSVMRRIWPAAIPGGLQRLMAQSWQELQRATLTGRNKGWGTCQWNRLSVLDGNGTCTFPFCPPHKLIPWAWIFRKTDWETPPFGFPFRDRFSVGLTLFPLALGWSTCLTGGERQRRDRFCRSELPSTGLDIAWPDTCGAPSPLILIPPAVPFFRAWQGLLGEGAGAWYPFALHSRPCPLQASAILPHVLGRRFPTTDGRHH